MMPRVCRVPGGSYKTLTRGFGIAYRRCRPCTHGVRSAKRVHRPAGGHVRRVVKTISLQAIGTTAQLMLADDRHAAEAEALMRTRLHDIDSAASRIRPDSEIALVEAMGGPRRVSALLSGAVHTALAAARETGGVVDSFVPITVADALVPFASEYKPFWLAMGTIGADLSSPC
jgi:hypothetical protein